MSMVTKKIARPGGSSETDRAVVYRGIRIAPIGGKRSALAQAIREGLRAKYEQHRGDPVRS